MREGDWRERHEGDGRRGRRALGTTAAMCIHFQYEYFITGSLAVIRLSNGYINNAGRSL